MLSYFNITFSELDRLAGIEKRGCRAKVDGDAVDGIVLSFNR